MLLLAWLRLLTAAGQRDRPATDPAARSPSQPARPLPSHSAPSTRRRLVSPARFPLAGERNAPACAAFRLTPPLAATRLPPLLHAAPEPRPCAPPQPSSACAPPLPSPACAPQLPLALHAPPIQGDLALAARGALRLSRLVLANEEAG